MTSATREALIAVSKILHEAGWDQPEESDPDAELASHLSRILSPDERSILALSLRDNMSPDELATKTGLTIEEIERRYRSALEKLEARGRFLLVHASKRL